MEEVDEAAVERTARIGREVLEEKRREALAKRVIARLRERGRIPEGFLSAMEEEFKKHA